MHAPGRPRARRPWLPIVGAALAVAAGVRGRRVAPWAAPSTPAAAAGCRVRVTVAPAPLALPEHARVLIFGDSWVYGSAAIVPTLGFAYVLGETEGWETVVDGVRGSGYLKPGIDGGTYGERIASLDSSIAPDLVIVEGSINDRRLPARGIPGCRDRRVGRARGTYPDASFVILGPSPQILPVESATARIDADLARARRARGWWYISPIADEWITPANYLEVIDTGIGRNHPSTEGHAYLADRLGRTLETFAEGADVVADAPLDEELVGP